MNTKLMFAALGLGLIATSCSQEEVVSMNPDNAIAFRASTMSSTRASETTLDDLKSFKVFAYQGENVFMDGLDGKGVLVSGSTSDGWSYANTQYWPNEGTLDFYSFAPADFPGYENKGFGAFTVEENADDQIDLLYAVNKNLGKANKTVNVNFRHALSQIVFKAKTTATCNLTIKIDEVSIAKVVKNAAGFTFPTSTDPNYVYSNDKTNNLDKDTQVGKWTLAELPTKTTFTTSFEAKTVNASSGTVNLTTSTDGAMFLLPQELEPWNVVEGNGIASKQNNAYFLVKCSIKDVEGNDIWGSDSATKPVAIPLAATWEVGKKYEYTFTFGKGAGYDPKDPDPDDPDPDPNPEPVLVEIDFDVKTIDDFMPGDYPTTIPNGNVNMDVE